MFALPYAANVGTRFLIPPLPFLSVALGLAVSGWKGAAPVVVLAHLFSCLPNVVDTYATPSAWRMREAPVKAALRIEPEESFLRARLPYYGLARLIEEKTPAGSRILGRTPPPEAYMSREVLSGYQAALNNTLRDILWTGVFPGLQPSARLTFRFPSQVLTKVRVVQDSAEGGHFWSMSELRIFRGHQELPRPSRWRLRAYPNPWEVQLAFDNSPATRWLSWQSLSPGMYTEVDFGRPEIVSTIQLESSPEQPGIRLSAWGETIQGNWIQLAEKPEETAVQTPPELRRLVAEELKFRGVDYILTFDSEPEARELSAHHDLWRVSVVAKLEGATLYRIE